MYLSLLLLLLSKGRTELPMHCVPGPELHLALGHYHLQLT